MSWKIISKMYSYQRMPVRKLFVNIERRAAVVDVAESYFLGTKTSCVILTSVSLWGDDV